MPNAPPSCRTEVSAPLAEADLQVQGEDQAGADQRAEEGQADRQTAGEGPLAEQARGDQRVEAVALAPALEDREESEQDDSAGEHREAPDRPVQFPALHK